MRITNVKNCGGPDQVIKIATNSTVKLTPQCEMIPNSCIETKGFKTAQVKYKLFKNNIPMLQGGPEDLCKQMEGSGGQIKGILEMFGMPTKCPVDASQVCSSGDTKLDMKKYKQFLGMAIGRIKAHADITHDTVCILFI